MRSLDYDPEGEFRQEDDDESDSQESEDDLAATEHYVSVGYDIMPRFWREHC